MACLRGSVAVPGNGEVAVGYLPLATREDLVLRVGHEDAGADALAVAFVRASDGLVTVRANRAMTVHLDGACWLATKNIELGNANAGAMLDLEPGLMFGTTGSARYLIQRDVTQTFFQGRSQTEASQTAANTEVALWGWGMARTAVWAGAQVATVDATGTAPRVLEFDPTTHAVRLLGATTGGQAGSASWDGVQVVGGQDMRTSCTNNRLGPAVIYVLGTTMDNIYFYFNSCNVPGFAHGLELNVRNARTAQVLPVRVFPQDSGSPVRGNAWGRLNPRQPGDWQLGDQLIVLGPHPDTASWGL
mgnify:CR=1 FL=1